MIRPTLDYKSQKALYMQLYEHIRDDIISGRIAAGEKLPSLRSLSDDISVSVTTVSSAYNQLLVEGYLISKPQSGYYAAEMNRHGASDATKSEPVIFESYPFSEPDYIYDLHCFDFFKWKKCMDEVLTDYSHLLLFESDPQGEEILRAEIARYIYSYRGVNCSADQIVISAGTQQLLNHLARLTKPLGISRVSVEDPGYEPVQNIFRDHGFVISKIPVADDGIVIEKLPANIASAVYVSPSNQFPTGTVMPIGRRFKLLSWAEENHSLILEDDYDSELRYFGKPVPALQGLDDNGRVIYFGSFSSTLFPAIKLSYMVLPGMIAKEFNNIKEEYDQPCSKEEQLALSLFIEKGYYAQNIKRLRNLYSQKLQAVTRTLQESADFITAINSHSGINITLRVSGKASADELCRTAKNLKLQVTHIPALSTPDESVLILYYNQIPLSEIPGCIKALIDSWR